MFNKLQLNGKGELPISMFLSQNRWVNYSQ